MDTQKFSAVNLERCQSPEGFNHRLDSWSLSDWMTAIAGEVGEAANVVKKLNRFRDGIPGNKHSEEELREMLAAELADAVVYLDLMFQRIGRDMGTEVGKAFNRKSEEIGCPIRFKEEGSDTLIGLCVDMLRICRIPRPSAQAEALDKIQGRLEAILQGDEL